MARINCYEETSFSIKDGRILHKQIVRVVPELAREQVASTPVLIGIAENYNLAIDYNAIEWDDVGRDKPDGIVHVRNDTNFWVEHTRISDHFHHFINERLKQVSNQVLDATGAPLNLIVRYPENTQVRAARTFCSTWQEWEMVPTAEEALQRIQLETAAHPDQPCAFRVSDPTQFRLYLLEVGHTPINEILETEIRSKERKYGLSAARTVLILDDETRARTSAEIMTAAEILSTTISSTFKAIYMVSFTGLFDGNNPQWLMQEIKSFR